MSNMQINGTRLPAICTWFIIILYLFKVNMQVLLYFKYLVSEHQTSTFQLNTKLIISLVFLFSGEMVILVLLYDYCKDQSLAFL